MKYIDSLPDFYIAKTKDHHLGVFTSKHIKKGTVIFTMKGDIINYPTRTSVQIGKTQHIENQLAGYINHACHPNAKVNKKNHTFVSLRDIPKDEEITFDYNKNEDILASPFRCFCCHKKILGKKVNFPSLTKLKEKLKQIKSVPI